MEPTPEEKFIKKALEVFHEVKEGMIKSSNFVRANASAGRSHMGNRGLLKP